MTGAPGEKAVAAKRVAAVPVPVLEALASEWEEQRRQMHDNADAARYKAGDGIRRAFLYEERAQTLTDCARMLRQAIADRELG
jgi:hypothetical protein